MDVQLRPIRRQDGSGLVVLLGQLGHPSTEKAVHERLDYWLGGPSNRLVAAEGGGDLIEELARAAGCVRMEITSSRHRTKTHEFYQQLGYEDVCNSSARLVKSLAGSAV